MLYLNPRTNPYRLAAETVRVLTERGETRKAERFAEQVGYDPNAVCVLVPLRRVESLSRAYLRTS